MSGENMEWLNYFPAFLLVFVRILSFFMTMPIFSYQNIPSAYKLGLSFYLAWIMVFTLDPDVIQIDTVFILLILKEVLIGLLVGIVAMMIFTSIQIAGRFIDLKIGFMLANVLDPQTGAQSPLIGSYLNIFAILFLLAIDAHHLLIDGIYYSYQFISLQQLTLPLGNEQILNQVVKAFSTMFLIGFQMAFPIVGSIFLVNVALGMVSRAVPQMNVFVVGMPLVILVGFPLLILTIPVFFMLVKNLFGEIIITMRVLMSLLGGS